MKVTSVESFMLSIPTKKPIALAYPTNRLVVVRISTDEGQTGLGYTLVFGGGGAEAVLIYLETRLKPLVVGKDPLFIEEIWENMYRVDPGIRRQGVAAYALSALDIGLWDIVGKVAGLPLYKLWGAAKNRIPGYGSGGWANYEVSDLIDEARRYVAMGFRYYKMKVHHPDPRVNWQRVEAVRSAVGDDVRLMVDVNHRLDVLGNIQLAKALEDLGLLWYEEPVIADDIASCAEVSRSIRIPIATGENNHTRFEFRELCERRAAHYLMPDVCRANGFSETLKIGHMAAAYQVRVTTHLVHELSIHVLGALDNGFLVEFVDWIPPDLFSEMPLLEDGFFRIPDRPGHGMALSPDAERRYRVT